MLPASQILACTLCTLSLFAPTLATLPGLSPTSPAPIGNATSILPVGNIATGYRNDDGSVNQEYLRKEMRHVAGKYSRGAAPGRMGRRAHGMREKDGKKEHGRDGAEGAEGGQTGEAPLTNEAIIEYDATVGMGTPSQDVIFNMDSGSADLWVGTEMTAGTSRPFNASKSSTYQSSTTPFRIRYGAGDVIGTVSSDTVSLAGFTVARQFFGAALVISSNFVMGPSAGIFGMAFQSLSTSGNAPWFQNVISQGVLAKNLFAFYLTRRSDAGSSVSFGKVDSTKFEGPIFYTPVTSTGYWQVLSKFVVDQKVISPIQAAVDTATTFIYAPIDLTARIYAAVPGATEDPVDNAFVGGTSSYYQYPCANQFTVSFSFGDANQTFAIDSRDFNIGRSSTDRAQCIGAIIGLDVNDREGRPLAIIGGSFLKNWYSVYNFNGTVDGAPAVGFAAVNATLNSL